MAVRAGRFATRQSLNPARSGAESVLSDRDDALRGPGCAAKLLGDAARLRMVRAGTPVQQMQALQAPQSSAGP